jgi:hypothetical protein
MIAFNLLSAQCYQDRHSSIADDAWISCEMTANPNSSRDVSHWIMYDFGEVYKLGQSHFWNINANERTDEGISEAVIDYSFDGITWTEWGTFNLNEANGSTFYEGEDGPHFNDLKARYILITTLSNHGGSCVGLSEIKIETSGITTSNEDLVNITTTQLSVYPNPADNTTQLNIASSVSLIAQMKINDMSGRTVSEQQVNIRKGDNQYTVDTSILTDGQYIINITSGEVTSFTNLSVIHAN